jgi:hypothetical protein
MRTFIDFQMRWSAVAQPKVLRRGWTVLLTLLVGLSLAACTDGISSQRTSCIIASNDKENGFRTDEIFNCRIDTATGNASFVFKQKQRTRSYVSMQPLTQQYRDVASYWANRSGQLSIPAATNPARFDPRSFLEAASQATDGFVLIRRKRSGAQAVNIVYITDGIYRSIDFSGTNVKETPSGFLTTGL